MKKFNKFDIYWKIVEVANNIPFVPVDGRKICKDYNINENKFCKVVYEFSKNLDYGVSPMHPWLIKEVDLND